MCKDLTFVKFCIIFELMNYLKHSKMTHKATHYTDDSIKSFNVGDIIEYPDGGKEQVIGKWIDSFTTYDLIQMSFINIKKNGQRGKLKRWGKYRKFKTTYNLNHIKP